MKTQDWKFVVDALLFICLAALALVGILLGLVLPEGPAAADMSKYFLGLHRHQWGNLHGSLSIAFAVLMTVHLLLSWKWITAKLQQVFPRRATSGPIALAALPFGVVLLLWAMAPRDADRFRAYGSAAGPVSGLRAILPAEILAPGRAETGRSGERAAEAPEAPAPSSGSTEHEDRGREVGSIEVTGQTTVRDLAAATGISAGSISRRLGLPESVSGDTALGRLRRTYGFEIQDVRDLMVRLLREKKAGGE